MKRRLLVPVSTPLSYAVVAPIVVELARDPELEVMVAARHGGESLARECLAAPFTFRAPWIARFVRFDVALCPGFFFRSARRGTAVQIFHGVSPKNYAVAADVRRFDSLFLTGEYHRAKFERAGLLERDDPRALAVGMPKTDPLVIAPTAAERARFHLGLGIDPALPLVAYVPTRSGSHGSSIDEAGTAIIDALAALPVNVVVKLHDRSQRRFRPKLGVDHESAIVGRENAGASRVRLYRGHDVVPLLRHAAVLVSDLSSVTNEFLLCDRPIVYAATSRHDRKIRKSGVRRFGSDDPHDLDWLRAAGESGSSPQEIRAATVRALEEPRYRSDLRRERSQVMFYNPGAATAVAVRETRRLLGLSPERTV